MNHRIAEADVELLLMGRAPADTRLESLAGYLRQLRAIGETAPDPAFGLIVETAAIAGRKPGGAPITIGKGLRRQRSWRLAPIMAAASALFVLAGMTGVAAAADSAGPGDILYGIDRALENIGVGNGGVAERLSEAEALALEGDAGAALDHAGDALAEAGDRLSAEALLATANRLRSQGSTASRTQKESVAEMLEWMANTDETGRSFGQGVAERARNIGANGGQLGSSSGQPDNKENSQGNGNANGNGNGKSKDKDKDNRPGNAKGTDRSGLGQVRSEG